MKSAAQNSIMESLDDDLDAGIHGTRAYGTESLVYRVLQSQEQRTESILIRLIEAAFASMLSEEQVRTHGESKLHTRDIIRKRARKLMAMIARRGPSAIPKNTLDLVAWSELSDAEMVQPIEAIVIPGAKLQRTARRKARHFKSCRQCGVRFLAKRSGQEFHSGKCGLRWRRNHPDDRRNCTASSGATDNTEVSEGVFAVAPVLALTPIPAVITYEPPET